MTDGCSVADSGGVSFSDGVDQGRISCGLEDGVEVPSEVVAMGSVGTAGRDRDGLAGFGVELFAVAELGTQTRTYQQAIVRVDGKVSAVKQRVDVRA